MKQRVLGRTGLSVSEVGLGGLFVSSFGAEFEQGPLTTQAGEGERGVLAGGKDKMKLRRKVLQQKGQGRMN